MILLLHIIIALSSIGFSTYVIFSPSRSKLWVGYGLTTATIVSGTYLVISTHAQMLQACMTGLAYLGFVSLELAIAHRRLAKATAKID